MYLVSGVIYPIIPTSSPPTDLIVELTNFTSSLGSSETSMLALTTPNVTLSRKDASGSTPRSNSWFPRH